mgnify:CR=1 FL=1
MKAILLHIFEDDGLESRLAVALDICRAQDAHLSCVYITPYAAYIGMDPMGGVFASGPIIQSLREAEDKSRKRVEARLAHEDVRWDWQSYDGDPAQTLVSASALADLVIVSQADPEAKGGNPPLPLVDMVCVNGGCPVLVVPKGVSQFDALAPIVIGWNDSEEAARAIREALPALRLAQQVIVVSVGEEEEDYPQTEACTYLARHGTPQHPSELLQHTCLTLSSDASQTRGWAFQVPGEQGSEVSHLRPGGPLDCSDGQVLHDWCLAGYGIAWRSTWEVEAEIQAGQLVAVLEEFAAPPSETLLLTTTVVVALLYGVAGRWHERYQPLRVVVRAMCLVQGSACVFFALVPARFPWSVQQHLSGLMQMGADFVLVMPWMLAVGWGLLNLPWRLKLLGPVAVLAYFVVWLPHQVVLHAWVLHHGSALFMPVLLLCLGPLLNGWIFVAPNEGMSLWSITQGRDWRYAGGRWTDALDGAALRIAGKQVVGPQQPAIAVPQGGANPDSEARLALGLIISCLRAHGLIAN